MKKRILSIIMVLSLCLSMLPTTAWAAEDTGLCEHHPVHTAECGYAEAVAGQECTHVHDEDCGYAEAAEETPCGHTHDETCGYAEAREGSPCAFALGCADCVAEQTSAEPPEEPEEDPVCTCETACGGENGINFACAVCAEDFGLCAQYVPTCTCAEKCTEDSINDFCALCAADHTTCAGTDTAAMYDTTATIGGFTVTGDSANYNFDDSEGVLTITGGGPLTISNANPGSHTENRIVIADGVTASVTLDNVNIKPYSNGYNGKCALEVAGSAQLHLTLVGENTLISGYYYAGLQVGEGASLVITEGSAGSLTATGGGSAAGIGGGNGDNGGSITIQNGTVTATSGAEGAGIGGGNGKDGTGGDGGTIIISGGTVTASSPGGNAAGIGGGNSGDGGNITISGGKVTATSSNSGAGIGGGKGGGGGTIAISGAAEVTATGGYGGAGIGGGTNQGDGGSITINGGMVTATGGGYAAGIGGGEGGSGGNIEISGGEVTATGGGSGAGIGGGYDGEGGTITIGGGDIIANGGHGAAGIGGGRNRAGGSIAITSGTVTANGGNGGSGIGGGNGGEGGTITIGGGDVIANGGDSGAGIGGGDYQVGGIITITDGTINAIGGAYAAGIGGGNSQPNGTVTITGGTVKAIGGTQGAGIGGGSSGGGGTITISGGIVDATGGTQGYGAAGIGGGGDGGGGDITISGGSVTATGTGDGSGIGNAGTGSGGTFSTGENGNAIIEASSIIASSAATASYIEKNGNEYTVHGHVTLTEDLTISEGASLAIPEDATLTVADGVTLTLAEGSEVKTGDGPEIAVGTGGGALDASGNVVAGSVTINGSTITGTDITVSSAGVVSSENPVTAGNTVVTLPSGGAITVDADGTISVPAGSKVKTGDGTEITVRADGTVASDGTVTASWVTIKTETASGEEMTTIDGHGKDITVGSDGAADVPGGASITTASGTEITLPPASSGSVSSDGTISVPEGSTVTSDGTTAKLSQGGSVTSDGEITVPTGGTITTTDENNITTTITPANGGPVSINDDGEIEVPAGSTVQTGANGPSITVGEDGTVDRSGNVTANEVQIGNTTITGDGVQIAPDGTASIPAGGTVQTGNGPSITLPEGGTSDEDGAVMADKVQIGDTTITGGGITVAPDGTAAVPTGGTVQTGDGSTITLPNGGTTDSSGAVTVPSGGTVEVERDGTTTAITLPSGGTVSTNNDGQISVPGGSIVQTGNGDAVTVPEIGGMIDPSSGEFTPNSHTVCFDTGEGSAISPASVPHAGKITKPADPTRSGYNFGGWYKDAGCSKAWDFENDAVTASITLYAKWTVRPSSGGGGGGYTPPSTNVTVPISGNDSSIQVSATVSGNTATIRSVDLSALDTVIGEGVDTGVVTIDFSGLSKTIDTVTLPANVVREIAEAVNDPQNDAHSLEIVLSNGLSIEFDAASLKEKAAQANGQSITISIKAASASGLTSAQRNAVGNRPAYSITVSSGGRPISDMGGKITIHAPYTLRTGEVGRGIVVYYVAENGGMEACETSYDPVRQRVNWKTDHLSLYMTGYDEKLAEVCDGGEDCPSAKFIDIDPNAWYHEALDYAIENGLMGGYGNGCFGPSDNLSRGMLAQILYNLEGRPTVSSQMPFTDVSEGRYYYNAILWAQANGIVGGYGGGLFGPDDNITREQLATILWRYAQVKGYDVSVGENTNILSYEDAFTISEYAIPAIQWACGDGVMQGSGGYLNPKGSATRAHVAQMLMRFLENVMK